MKLSFSAKKNTWLGVSGTRVERFYDPSIENLHPLQFSEHSQKVFANGSLYEEDASFDFGLKRWEGPCLYLKALSDYEPSQTECSSLMAYVCEWKGKDISDYLSLKC